MSPALIFILGVLAGPFDSAQDKSWQAGERACVR